MSQGDIKAFIDEQIKQFLAFGREDLAEQVERAIALVAEGKCSAGVCYTIFESAKRELLNLSNDYDAAKNKKKRARRKTVAVVPGALQRRGRQEQEQQPATPNAGAATIKIKAPAGMTLEEGVPELLQEAATEIRARILYHVLRIIEQRTEPLHSRERPTTYPRKELENIVYAQPPAEQAVEHTDDYALEQAQPADKKRRKKKKKKTVSRQQSATPPAGVKVDFALLYQAIQLGVCNPGERLDLKLPAHLLTRFELTWMRSQKK
jgi:hypothetical protein